ncbi:MAG: lipase family protein [Planctomycetota bacterium]
MSETSANADDGTSPIGVDTENRVVQQAGETPLIIHSDVTGPIADLTFLQRALLFAELAKISYNDEKEATVAGALAGFDDVTYYDNDGSQAYRFRNQWDCVIACRGTEATEWNDIQADANAVSVLAETVGRVHSGFKNEVDDLWPMLEEAIGDNQKPIWFCGHSLGGAMATICAGRCHLAHIPSVPEQLYTYGSPRVGDDRYVNFVELEHFRFVNNNDIVATVPPAWMGYRHTGREVYIDRNGKLRKLRGWFRARDKFKGFVRGLMRWQLDQLSDHSMNDYIAHINAALKIEREQIASGGGPIHPDEIAAKAKKPRKQEQA